MHSCCRASHVKLLVRAEAWVGEFPLHELIRILLVDLRPLRLAVWPAVTWAVWTCRHRTQQRASGCLPSNCKDVRRGAAGNGCAAPIIPEKDHTLIPVQAEPLQVADHGLFALAGGARQVGVFYAQHKLATVAAGVQPVEEGRPGTADVKVAGGRRSEAHTNLRVDWLQHATKGVIGTLRFVRTGISRLHIGVFFSQAGKEGWGGDWGTSEPVEAFSVALVSSATAERVILSRCCLLRNKDGSQMTDYLGRNSAELIGCLRKRIGLHMAMSDEEKAISSESTPQQWRSHLVTWRCGCRQTPVSGLSKAHVK